MFSMGSQTSVCSARQNLVTMGWKVDKQEKRTEKKCQVVCLELGEFKVHLWLLFLHYACIHKLFGKNGSNCVMVKAYHQGQIANQNYFCFYLHMMPIALLQTHLEVEVTSCCFGVLCDYFLYNVKET